MEKGKRFEGESSFSIVLKVRWLSVRLRNQRRKWLWLEVESYLENMWNAFPNTKKWLPKWSFSWKMLKYAWKMTKVICCSPPQGLPEGLVILLGRRIKAGANKDIEIYAKGFYIWSSRKEVCKWLDLSLNIMQRWKRRIQLVSTKSFVNFFV